MSRRALMLALAAPLALPLVLIVAAVMLVTVVAGGGSVSSADVPAGGVSGGELSPGAGVPVEYVPMIRGAVAAGGCSQLTESVLAAQLKQESGFSPVARSAVGAVGIAQFMPATWKSWGRDENGDGTASADDPQDAIPAAGRYDCSIAKAVAGVPGDPAELMLAGYNAGPGAVLQYRGVPPYQETQNYVRVILAKAQSWATSSELIGGGVGPVPQAPSGQVELTGLPTVDTAVAWAVGQVGSWYHYGGSCTDPFGASIAGRCDCSSLMQQAYAHAGVALPRTAAMQSREGDPVNPADIQPGDLVVTVGSDGTVQQPGHIALYVGRGLVVEAPYEGVQVHFLPVRAYRDIVTIRRMITG